jgi:hypothetical protein
MTVEFTPEVFAQMLFDALVEGTDVANWSDHDAGLDHVVLDGEYDLVKTAELLLEKLKDG